MVLFVESGCIWANVLPFGHKWFYLTKMVVSRQKWFYLGNKVVFR